MHLFSIGSSLMVVEKGNEESEKGEKGIKKNSRAKLLYYFLNNLICLKSRNLE
jgi:hypothetical protein